MIGLDDLMRIELRRSFRWLPANLRCARATRALSLQSCRGVAESRAHSWMSRMQTLAGKCGTLSLMPIDLQHGVPFAGTANNVRLRNETVEVVVPTTYGPRIMGYARPGAANMFAEVSPRMQRVATPFGEDWHIYGGHRLWAAPEDSVRSYYPDNRAVEVESAGHTLTVRQAAETHTGLAKQLAITLYERSSRVSVVHGLRNEGTAALELAPWALSAMAPGGTAIFPQPPFAPHPRALAPARPLVLWPFTRMSDPRYSWGDRFILLRQDSDRPEPQKFGFFNDCGFMAYARSGELFVKCHLPSPGPHADFGCNAQTFTNELFLELESLGPMVTLAPSESVTHREEWFLFDDFEDAWSSESALATSIAEVLARIAEQLAAHGDQPELMALLERGDEKGC